MATYSDWQPILMTKGRAMWARRNTEDGWCQIRVVSCRDEPAEETKIRIIALSSEELAKLLNWYDNGR